MVDWLFWCRLENALIKPADTWLVGKVILCVLLSWNNARKVIIDGASPISVDDKKAREKKTAPKPERLNWRWWRWAAWHDQLTVHIKWCIWSERHGCQSRTVSAGPIWRQYRRWTDARRSGENESHDRFSMGPELNFFSILGCWHTAITSETWWLWNLMMAISIGLKWRRKMRRCWRNSSGMIMFQPMGRQQCQRIMYLRMRSIGLDLPMAGWINTTFAYCLHRLTQESVERVSIWIS